MIEFIYEELSKKKVQITDSIEIDLDSIIDYDIEKDDYDNLDKFFNV